MKRILIAIIFLFQSLCLFAMTSGEARVAREKFVAAIKEQVGKPYEYGAVGPDAFDCSGLIYYVARTSISKQMPRTAKALYNDVRIIPDDKKEIGDILFFRTTNTATISHVGVYIGDNKFISALSDGNESGVTISALNSFYWKERYVGVGQFLPSGFSPEEKIAVVPEPEPTTEQKVVKKGNQKKTEEKPMVATRKPSKKEVDEVESVNITPLDNLIFDTSFFFDWSLLSPRQFVFRYRGIDALAHIKYAGWDLEPGLGIAFRYNYGLKTIQMPITLSVSLNDFVGFYAGPVITFDSVKLIDTDRYIRSSVFPGVVGVSFTTPAYDWKGFSFYGVQDVSYTIYNKLDGSTLSFMDGLAAGLVMYTGVKVAFPLSIFRR